MRYSAPLIVFFFIIQTALFAQTSTLYQKAEDHQISIDENNSRANASTQKVLELLQKAKNHSENKSPISISIIEHRDIIKTGNRVDASISIGNYVLESDYTYQKFDINDLLNPSLLNFAYRWNDAQGNAISESDIETVKFKSGQRIVNIKEEYHDKMEESKILLSTLNFDFSKKDFEKLKTFYQNVDEYYNADARLNMMASELDKITYDTLELLDEYLQVTINNTKTINNIKAKRLNSKLRLDLNDPIQFKSHLGQVEVKNREVKKELEATLNNMHKAYYLKGLDWLKWKNNQKARTFFELSITTQPKYAPPHFELAKYSFKNKNYRGTLDSCSNIILHMAPDNDTRYNTLKLAEKCIFELIDSVKYYSNNNQFVDAFKTLDYAKNYAQSIEGFRQFPEFTELYQSLYKKMYQHIADKAQKQIQEKNLKDAQTTIDSLVSFRLSHQEFYIDPKQEDELLGELYHAWTEKGKYQLERNNPDSAIYALTNAQIICNKHKAVACNDKLIELLYQAYKLEYIKQLERVETTIHQEFADSALRLLAQASKFRENHNLKHHIKADTLFIQAKQLKHNQLIVLGDKAGKHNQSEEALAFYEEAHDIAKQVNIEQNAQLTEKLMLAAKNCILQFCTQAETYAEAMQLSKARQKLAKAELLHQKYKLNANIEATKAIEQLKNKLNEGECGKVVFDFNIQLTTAEKFIDQKEFAFAREALKKAIKMTEKHERCLLSDSVPKKRIIEIAPILTYQQKMQEINQMIKSKSFAHAIEGYKQLGIFYTDSCTLTFSVKHKTLDDFIIENKNGEILDYAIRYYLGKNNIEMALKLINTLHSRDYIASWSKKSQIALGMALAKRDYEQKPEADPKLKVLEYTQEDKWFKFLRKGYLKQWKKL